MSASPATRRDAVDDLVFLLGRLGRAAVFFVAIHTVAGFGLNAASGWTRFVVGTLPVTLFAVLLATRSGLERAIPFALVFRRSASLRSAGDAVPIGSFLVAAAVYLVGLTMLVAVWHAFLSRQGVVPTADGVVRDGVAALAASERFFVWHLVDAVPILAIPDTLQWTEGTAFSNRVSGGFLLAYKILVVVPLSALLIWLFELRIAHADRRAG